MKKIIKFIVFCGLPFLFASCESNDTIADLSNPGVFIPNAYLSPIDPIASAGASLETELEYWSEDDEFVSIEMLQNVVLEDEIEFNLSAVDYDYTYEGNRDKIEEDLVAAIPHNFNTFVPAKNAYVIRPFYEVPNEFSRVNYDSTNTEPSALAALLPEEAIDDFYGTLSFGLDKSELQTILVEVDSVISLTTFESYYNESSLTESGRESARANLETIGIAGLVDADFTYRISHRVALFFRIENGLGGINTSVARGVTIN